MRGKTIVFVALLAMLFSAMMPTLSFGATTAVYMTPAAIHNEDMHLGYTVPWKPGDPPPTGFSADIMVQDVEDLYAWALTIDYASYSVILAFSSAVEGDFLLGEGIETDFNYKVNSFAGDVDLGNARLGQVPGVSGSGMLCTVSWVVVEGGDSPLDLVDVELYDSNGDPIGCTVTSGWYYGPYVEMDFASWDYSGRGDRPWVHWKDNVWFDTTVTNFGEVPLYARVKYDILRTDGRMTTIWAGQNHVSEARATEYLYVNEYYEFVEWDTWTGDRTNVVGTPDGSYVESGNDGALTSSYCFEDVTLGPGDAISRIVLEGYCQYPNGPTEGADIDVYTIAPTVFDWLGSLYGGYDWAWVTPRWIDADVTDVYPEMKGNDASVLNSLEVALYNYYGDAPDIIRVDALRLRVEFALNFPLEVPVFEVPPGETLALDTAYWSLMKIDKGFYTSIHVTCYFSYYYPNSLILYWIIADTEFDLGWMWVPGQGPGPG